MARGFCLFGVEESDLSTESGFEDLDELGGEGDFWDQQDDRLVFFKGFLGELEVDVGFAGAGDAVEEFGGVRREFEFFDSGFLIRI